MLLTSTLHPVIVDDWSACYRVAQLLGEYSEVPVLHTKGQLQRSTCLLYYYKCFVGLSMSSICLTANATKELLVIHSDLCLPNY